jgi:PIN domain nuclease of toxin-antitoxin system
MNLLLDTSAFLWYISGDRRLPVDVRDAIRDPDAQVWLSVLSLWEAAIKQQLSRLQLPDDAWSYLTRQRDRHDVGGLDLSGGAVAHLSKLPGYHRDPFDRMLICQAIEHALTIVTGDAQVTRYPVKVLWS